jgi:predicted ATP-dependent serine protease
MEEQTFNLRTMQDILDDKTEPDWIVEGILMRGAITFLTGESGSFKTFLALDLANRLTNTQSDRWLNHIIDRKSRSQFQNEDEIDWALEAAFQQLPEVEMIQMLKSIQEDEGAFRVLYIMAESTASAGHRQEAWMQTTGLRTSPHFWMVPESVHLQDLEELVDAAEAHAKDIFDVIIVDTFSANTPGVDENSKQSLSPALAALRKMKERNKAVLVIHHGTKDGKSSFRGHSSIENDTDIRFVAERDGTAEIIKLKSDRQKEFEDWPSYHVRVPVVALVDEDGRPRTRRSGQLLTSRAVEGPFQPPTVHDEVLIYLETRSEGATTQEIAESLGVEYDTAAKRVSKLFHSGAIQRNVSKQPYVYFLETVEEL